MTPVAVVFWTLLGLRVLVAGSGTNCRTGICHRQTYSTAENQLIKPAMLQSRSRLQRIRDIAIHKPLVYSPRNAINRKNKYPIRIKISRNSMKKYFKNAKAKSLYSKNQFVKPIAKIPYPRSVYLEKDRLRRHMSFINR